MQRNPVKRVELTPETEKEQHVSLIGEILQTRFRTSEAVPTDMLDLLNRLK